MMNLASALLMSCRFNCSRPKAEQIAPEVDTGGETLAVQVIVVEGEGEGEVEGEDEDEDTASSSRRLTLA